MTTEPLDLLVQNVSVSYGDVQAVNDVSLRLPPGVTVVLGPSGCGKSSLLRAIAGLEPLTAGTIRYGSEDLAGIPVFRRRFGLMFQSGVLFPHRTVAGNIEYGLRMLRIPRAERMLRVRSLLELVNLRGFENRKVDTLSGGEAQRVALARALAPRPRLLLLDEPLAALDASLREQLMVDLREILFAEGIPTLLVTHDQQEAFAVADRVILMKAGRILQQGTPSQVWSHPDNSWAAEFLGYRSVLPLPTGIPELDEFGAGAEALALRPSALQVSQAGAISGQVLHVLRGPDRCELRVRVPLPMNRTAGQRDSVDLPAWASTADVPLGAAVQLAFSPGGAAWLSADRTEYPSEDRRDRVEPVALVTSNSSGGSQGFQSD
jgi:thiamine transport system ATP-binding protein